MRNLNQYVLESLKGYKPGAIKPKEQLPQSCEKYFANQKVDVDDIAIFCNCYSLTNIIFGPGWGKSNADNINLILSDCGLDKGYKLSDETYKSMLTMYDRKKAGLSPMEITFNRRHNIPDGWKEKMKERGYIIELK